MGILQNLFHPLNLTISVALFFRKHCQCSPDGSCDADDLLVTATTEDVSVPETRNYTPRNLGEQDRVDLRLSLSELKERNSSGIVYLFHKETCHGFTDKLLDDITEHANHVFSGKYLADNLAMYS